MIAFWVAAALLSAAAIALVAYFAGREPITARTDPAAAVYRRQLDEIDDLADRGLLGEEERKTAHAEAARRLLGAGEIAPEKPPTRKLKLAVIGGSVVAALVAMGVYLVVGAPGQPDMPFKARAAQWAKIPDDQLGQLGPERAAVVLKQQYEKDGKPETLFRLAMAQAQAGEVQLGIHNMKRVAELAPEQPQVWTALGQLLIAATPDGTVPPEAVVDFNKALALDPKAAMPRFLLGQAKVESGDVAGGVAMWRALQSEMPPGGEAAKAMDQFIAKAEGGGGAAAPAAAPAGPQSDMIQGMVASLAAKLKQNPNDVDGWSRLIRSYAVLGDTAKMNAALEEARRIFKDRPSDRARIESAADKPQ